MTETIPISLTVVIVNWNSGNQLRECVSSIREAAQKGFTLQKIMVVDNASTDGSLEGLDNVSDRLTIIRNPENRGYGMASNQGAHNSQSDYLLFLNPDTRLLHDSLWEPIEFMERPENKQVGITGIQLLDDHGGVARSCTRFPSPSILFSKMLGLDRLFPKRFPSHFMREWDHSETRQVDQVIGAFWIVRRSVFAEMGGFDPRFFVYFEDVDFALRAYKKGWKSIYLAEAQAYHKGGGVTYQVKAERLFYNLRSRIIYGYKHFDWWMATGVMLGTLLIEPIARLALAARYRSIQEAQETVRGFAMLLQSLPALWRKLQQQHNQAQLRN